MLPLTPVLLALAGATGFCEANVCLTSPVAHSEITAGTGVLSSGYRHGTGIVADSFAFAEAGYRHRASTFSWLYVDASIAGLTALSRDGSHPGIAATTRIGYAGSKLAFSLGINAQLEDTPSPLALFPSLTLSYRSGAFGVSAGVLDRPVGPLAHVTFEYGSFGLGYAAPFGLDAYARFRLTRGISLHVGGFGYQVFQAFSLGGQVGLAFGEGAIFQLGGDS